MNGENLVKVSAHTTHGQLRDVNKKKTMFKNFWSNFRPFSTVRPFSTKL